ncbi:MAG: hypothetical protein WA728_35935 [Xanthobacteraceae bacterium]
MAVFSSDAAADDWHRHIKPDQIITLAMRQLEALGKGILLLHDIVDRAKNESWSRPDCGSAASPLAFFIEKLKARPADRR